MKISKVFMNETIVIENDGKSVWAYLINTKSGQFIKDAFICSPIEPEESLDKQYIQDGNPPKMCKEYATDNAYIPDVDMTQFNVLHAGRSGSYCIFYKQQPIAAIYSKFEKGYSMSISSECGFGMPWDQEMYTATFQRTQH